MFRALSAITIASAAGFVAARQLMSNETNLDKLPEGVRTPLKAARNQLFAARERARIALAEGRAEKTVAEAELTARYREQTGRTQGSGASTSLPTRL